MIFFVPSYCHWLTTGGGEREGKKIVVSICSTFNGCWTVTQDFGNSSQLLAHCRLFFSPFLFLGSFKTIITHIETILSEVGCLDRVRKGETRLSFGIKMGFLEMGIWEFYVVGCFYFLVFSNYFLFFDRWGLGREEKMLSSKEFWTKKTLVGLGLGQFLSLLITSTGFSSSELARRGLFFCILIIWRCGTCNSYNWLQTMNFSLLLLLFIIACKR